MQCWPSKKWSWCVLEKCVKDNHYARIHTQRHCCCREKWTKSRTISTQGFVLSYQCCREMYLMIETRRKFWQSQWSMKCGEDRFMMCAWRVCQGQLPMQAFIPTATTFAQKCTFFLDWTQHFNKVSGAWNEGQGYRVKVPVWRVCQGQLLCKVSSSHLPLLQRNYGQFGLWLIRTLANSDLIRTSALANSDLG